jgi:hypothetical protein
MLRERVGAREWQSARDQVINILRFEIEGARRVDCLLRSADRVQRLEDFVAADREFARF